jgi:hypothetical protein
VRSRRADWNVATHASGEDYTREERRAPPTVLSARSGKAEEGITLVQLASTVHKRRAQTTNDKRGEYT